MSRKKIIFIIVEGPSDQQALGVLLTRIYNSQAVYVHVMHCDITTEPGINSSNIVAKIGNLVKQYAGRTFKYGDFRQIIHIIDTDGAFIPDAAVVQDDTAIKPLYSVSEIRTRNRTGLVNRNHQKQENLNRLSSTSKVWHIPYQVYYMACNLDHALYGKLNRTDEQKAKDAFRFAQKYRNNIPGFMNYIRESSFSVIDSYPESWKYIREGLHSLERHTNLGICFESEEFSVQ